MSAKIGNVSINSSDDNRSFETRSQSTHVLDRSQIALRTHNARWHLKRLLVEFLAGIIKGRNYYGSDGCECVTSCIVVRSDRPGLRESFTVQTRQLISYEITGSSITVTMLTSAVCGCSASCLHGQLNPWWRNTSACSFHGINWNKLPIQQSPSSRLPTRISARHGQSRGRPVSVKGTRCDASMTQFMLYSFRPSAATRAGLRGKKGCVVPPAAFTGQMQK